MKAAVLSDTHNLLREEVLRELQTCDAVIHAGDIGSREVLDRISFCRKPGAPLYAVRGNNDTEWAKDLPEHLVFTLAGVNFFLVHDKKDVPADLDGRDVVIFGHSHKYSQEQKAGRLWLNPGSCGRKRFTLPVTMAILHLQGETFWAERIELSPVIPKASSREKQRMQSESGQEPWRRENGGMGLQEERTYVLNLIEQTDFPEIVAEILRRMDKGQSIQKISHTLKLEEEFVETVCRIRVTHPGVSAAGIADKLEVNQRLFRTPDDARK